MTLLIHADSAATIEGRKSPMVELVQWVEDRIPGCFSLLATQHAPTDPPPLRRADWVTLPTPGKRGRDGVSPDRPTLAGSRLLDTYAEMYRPVVSLFVGEPAGIWIPTAPTYGYRIALTLSEQPQAADLSLDWRGADRGSLDQFDAATQLLVELRKRLPLCMTLMPGQMRIAVDAALDHCSDRPALELYATGGVTDELLDAVTFAHERFDGPIELQLGFAQSVKSARTAFPGLRKLFARRQRLRVRVVSEVAPVAAHELLHRAFGIGRGEEHGA